MEDKRNESDRVRTKSERGRDTRGTTDKQGGGRNEHVAGVPRSTAHNARKRIEKSIGGGLGGRLERR